MDTYIEHALNRDKVVRWADSKKDITVFIDNQADWSPERVKIVQDAFASWTEILERKFKIKYVTDQGESDITVYLGDRAPLLDGDRHNERAGFHKIDVRADLLAIADLYLFQAYHSGTPFTDQEIRRISSHEVGHALGIHGHSPYSDDIMYGGFEPEIASPSGRDIATIKELYKRKPDITNPPNIPLVKYRAFITAFNAGILLSEENKHKEALDKLKQAHQLYPEHPAATYQIGVEYYYMGNDALAIKHIRKVLNSTPTPLVNNLKYEAQYVHADALFLNGQAALNAGEKEKGIRRIQEATRLLRDLQKAYSEKKVTDRLEAILKEYPQAQ